MTPKHRHHPFYIVITLFLLLISNSPAPSFADEKKEQLNKALEQKVKAAYFYRFLQLTNWPQTAFENNTSAIRACFVGSNPYIAVWKKIENHAIAEHTILVLLKSKEETLSSCHAIVFFSPEFGPEHTKDYWVNTLSAIHLLPILTVGEGSTFVYAGGLLGFQIAAGKVRFISNKSQAEAVGINLSANLLAHALEVK